MSQDTDVRERTQKVLSMQWVLQKAQTLPGMLVLGSLVILVWVLATPNAENPETLVPQNSAALQESPITELAPEVDSPSPGSPFVTMAGGEVTMTAQQAQFIVLTIVEQVELRPFMHGLTPQERADTVDGFIMAFNEALVMGDPSNPQLQKDALYQNGAALQEAARNDVTAQEAIDQYVSAFKDDLSYIGPENAGSADLVLAIVSLDALGKTEMAADYVKQVFDAKDALAKANLVDDLEQQGLDRGTLPDGFIEDSPENSSAPGNRPQAQSQPQESSAPNGETSPTGVEVVEEMGEPHQTGQPHIIPPLVAPQPMVGGLGFAPYNWVIFAQWTGRALSGHQLADEYMLESVNINEFEVFGKTLYYYVQLQILRVRDNGNDKSFPFVAIAGNVNELVEGGPIDYRTLADLAEFTRQRLKE